MLPRSSWGTLLLAYKIVLKDGRGMFAYLMRWPFAVAVAVMVFNSIIEIEEMRLSGGTGDGGTAGGGLLQILSWIVITPAITAWLRYVVDPSTQPAYGFLRWRRPEWVFVGRLIQIWVFTGIAAALPLLPLAALAGFDPAAVEAMGTVPLAAAGAASIVLSLLTMVSFGLSAAAAAVGAPSDLRLALQAAAGRRWHMLWAIIFSALAAMAVVLVFSVIGGSIAIVFTAAAGQGAGLYVGVLTGGLLVLPAYFLTYGVAAALAGLYYRWLVNQDFAVDGAMSRVRPAAESG